MLERGKMDRDVIEVVGIDSLVPQDHLLRKIDQAVDFSRLYEMVEPLYCGRSLLGLRRSIFGADRYEGI